MPVDEMKIFFHQTLVVSQTFKRATDDEKGWHNEDFCDYFAEKLSWQNKADTTKKSQNWSWSFGVLFV
jgi:hypothetical protein